MPLTSFYNVTNDYVDTIILGSMYAYFISLNFKYNDDYKLNKGSSLFNNFEGSLKWLELKNEFTQYKVLEILKEINKNCNGIKKLGVIDFEIKTQIMTRTHRFEMNNFFNKNKFIIKDHIEFIGDFELQ